MLEDIRGHSPLPDAQEIRWLAARPFREAARVAILALIAVVIGNLLPFDRSPIQPIAVAQARP